MSKPKFIKEIENFEGRERVKCGRWYIRVYGELGHKPMVELESLEIVVKELHKVEEENKKLNIKVASLEGEIKGLNYTIDKLKEENQTLELWLDNKEKLNEEYRDEIDLLKYQSYGPSELADSLYDANKTIEKLKEELRKYKEQYQHSMGFSDFGGYDE